MGVSTVSDFKNFIQRTEIGRTVCILKTKIELISKPILTPELFTGND